MLTQTQLDNKSLVTKFLRSQARVLDLVQELEREMKSMRERKVSNELIDKKDYQIERLVEFYNEVDDLFNYHKLALANARMENHFLTEMLVKKISVSELVMYKPSTKIIIQKLEDETLPQTLSELNG